jgi:hypothetical protein
VIPSIAILIPQSAYETSSAFLLTRHHISERPKLIGIDGLAGPPRCHKPGNGLAAPGDAHDLACLDAIDKLTQAGFRFSQAHLNHRSHLNI